MEEEEDDANSVNVCKMFQTCLVSGAVVVSQRGNDAPLADMFGRPTDQCLVRDNDASHFGSQAACAHAHCDLLVPAGKCKFFAPCWLLTCPVCSCVQSCLLATRLRNSSNLCPWQAVAIGMQAATVSAVAEIDGPCGFPEL